MNEAIKRVRFAAMLFVTAFAVTLAACGTSTGVATADPSASTPAVAHVNAQLATGYYTLASVRSVSNVLYNSQVIDKPTGVMIEGQCDTLRATLDAYKAVGANVNQTALDKTLDAITVLQTFVKAKQGGSS